MILALILSLLDQFRCSCTLVQIAVIAWVSSRTLTTVLFSRPVARRSVLTLLVSKRLGVLKRLLFVFVFIVCFALSGFF